ncbi:hypothetical protein QFZ91_004900 [Paraburkholderia sp. JPY419]
MDTHDFSGLPPAAQAYIRELEQGTADLAQRIQTLEERLRLAQSQRFAPRSVKLKDRVFNEAEQMAQAYDNADDAFALPDTGLPQVNEPERGKRGRKPLPANLRPSASNTTCLRTRRFAPAAVTGCTAWARITACSCTSRSRRRCCNTCGSSTHAGIASATQTARRSWRRCLQALPGSNASASVIATVTAGKFVDGTPLYRMADVFARADIPVGRGTLANWIIRPAELHYSRLYAALRKTLLSQPLIHGDETTVQVLKEPGKSGKRLVPAVIDGG